MPVVLLGKKQALLLNDACFLPGLIQGAVRSCQDWASVAQCTSRKLPSRRALPYNSEIKNPQFGGSRLCVCSVAGGALHVMRELDTGQKDSGTQLLTLCGLAQVLHMLLSGKAVARVCRRSTSRFSGACGTQRPEGEWSTG